MKNSGRYSIGEMQCDCECECENDHTLNPISSNDDCECPLLDAFSSLKRMTDEKGGAGTFSDIITKGESFLKDIYAQFYVGMPPFGSILWWPVECEEEIYSNTQVKSKDIVVGDPPPYSGGTLHTFLEAYTAIKQDLSTALTQISANNYAGLCEKYQSLVPLFKQIEALEFDSKYDSNVSALSGAMSDHGPENTKQILYNGPSLVYLFTELEGLLRIAANEYVSMCNNTIKIQDPPAPCDCVGKEMFENWQNMLTQGGASSVLSAMSGIAYTVSSKFNESQSGASCNPMGCVCIETIGPDPAQAKATSYMGVVTQFLSKISSDIQSFDAGKSCSASVQEALIELNQAINNRPSLDKFIAAHETSKFGTIFNDALAFKAQYLKIVQAVTNAIEKFKSACPSFEGIQKSINTNQTKNKNRSHNMEAYNPSNYPDPEEALLVAHLLNELHKHDHGMWNMPNPHHESLKFVAEHLKFMEVAPELDDQLAHHARIVLCFLAHREGMPAPMDFDRIKRILRIVIKVRRGDALFPGVHPVMPHPPNGFIPNLDPIGPDHEELHIRMGHIIVEHIRIIKRGERVLPEEMHRRLKIIWFHLNNQNDEFLPEVLPEIMMHLRELMRFFAFVEGHQMPQDCPDHHLIIIIEHIKAHLAPAPHFVPGFIPEHYPAHSRYFSDTLTKLAAERGFDAKNTFARGTIFARSVKDSAAAKCPMCGHTLDLDGTCPKCKGAMDEAKVCPVCGKGVCTRCGRHMDGTTCPECGAKMCSKCGKHHK